MLEGKRGERGAWGCGVHARGGAGVHGCTHRSEDGFKDEMQGCTQWCKDGVHGGMHGCRDGVGA